MGYKRLMLFPMRVMPGIEDGSVTLAFRRWRRPAARPGGRQRTIAGELTIDAVDPVELDAITEEEARRAGHPDLAGLRAELARHPDGTLYRIAFHRAGDDPRIALREDADLSPDEALGTHPVQVGVVDDRDLTGSQPLGQVLRPPVDANDTPDLGRSGAAA